jgi:hypothetical protein
VRPNLRLTILDKTAHIDVRDAARERGVVDIRREEDRKVYMNTSAVLSMDKRSAQQRSYQRGLIEELQYRMFLETIDANAFLSTPFRRESGQGGQGGQGVAVSRGIESEDERQIRIMCCILFPVAFMAADRKRVRRSNLRKMKRAFDDPGMN